MRIAGITLQRLQGMSAVDYRPIVEAVVRSWNRELTVEESGFRLGEARLRDLISRLTRALEIIAASGDGSVLFSGSVPEPRERRPPDPR